MITKILRASVRTQIAVITMALAIIVTIIGTSTEPFVRGRFDKGMQIGILAGQIDMIMDESDRRAEIPCAYLPGDNG